MYCEKCGAKLESDAKFCTKYGTSITHLTQTQNNNARIMNRNKRKKGDIIALIIVVAILYISFTSFINSITNNNSEGNNIETTIGEQAQEENSTADSHILTFLDAFSDYGYTADQIKEMKSILSNVGITEITNLEIGNITSGMQIIKGVAFKDSSLGGYKEVQVQFNIDSGKVYFVHIYCPDSSPYLSGLTDKRAELYYDSAGGYLKRIDWENKTVVDYEVLSTETNSNGEIVIGSDKYHPYILTVEEFSNELLTDFQEASEKYNKKWVKITGKVLDTSDAGTMYNYYIYGEQITTGYNGMRIICWCNEGPYSGSDIGNLRTFLGFVKISSSTDPIYIGGCEISR